MISQILENTESLGKTANLDLKSDLRLKTILLSTWPSTCYLNTWIQSSKYNKILIGITDTVTQ